MIINFVSKSHITNKYWRVVIVSHGLITKFVVTEIKNNCLSLLLKDTILERDIMFDSSELHLRTTPEKQEFLK